MSAICTWTPNTSCVTRIVAKRAEPASLPNIEEFDGVLPSGHNLRLAEQRKKNIVIMVTKEPHCLGDLLVRHAFENLEANVLAVVGSDDLLRMLTEKFEVPFHFVRHEGKSRQQHEEESGFG